jgi:DsbC/DsbD-like thiol-disulfide interchange protein/cytochrome c biogenesis protein CcdA
MTRQGLSFRLFHFILMILALTHVGMARAETHILPSLVSESSTAKAGETVALAISMKPSPGWHGYWKTPGDAGFPNDFIWTVSGGIKPAALRYPVPEKLLLNDLMNHVYNADYALLTSIKIPLGLPDGAHVPIRIKGQWLACTDKICVPEQAEFGTEITVGARQANPSQLAQFDKWRQKVARPLGSEGRFDAAGATVRIEIPLPASINIDDAWFFSETEKALSFRAPQKIIRRGDAVFVEAQKVEFGFESPPILKGVLALRDGTGLDITASPGTVATVGDSGTLATTLLALGGAILGGILLNIMPCVFPIISLKALSLAKAGGDEAEVRREALAYAAGVILTCLGLGGALLALRASGASVGWAFQLQDPRVILFLFLLISAIALNLAGLFSIKGFGGGESLAGKGGAVGAFWTGALAAFVATPCTGPFMAAALGAALVLPIFAALAIFAGLGLGLALPFLALGFVPALRAKMPRPGAWMGKLQRWLSLPMFLTAAALAWLLWRQTGSNVLFLMLSLTLVILALVWVIRRRMPLGIGFGALLTGVFALTLLAVPLLPAVRATGSQALAEGTERFSEARLAALRAKGAPVFLYFTADWCVTCKVNERAAIDRDEVVAHFRSKGIVTLVGDWTNGDPVISRFLEGQGRSGVPLYLYYGRGSAQPAILPQILTISSLTALD